MRNIRVFFKKFGMVKFTSHLDMNRYMSRALRRSGLPVWYTEGFNPHPYITFALPLSLGFESKYEIMDTRMVDDDVSDEQVMSRLNAVLPAGLEVFKVSDPVQKPGKITAASFGIYFETVDIEFAEKIENFMERDSILTRKKGKKGKISEVELAGRYTDLSVKRADGGVRMTLTLPAGGSDNVNPMLYLSAAAEAEISLPPYSIVRTGLYNIEGALFE